MSTDIPLTDLATETGFSESELRNLQKHFFSFTKGKDHMDSWDFRNLLGYVNDSVFTELVFNAFDKEGKNQVTFTEYIRGLRTMTKGTQEEKLAMSFRMMDLDRNGIVSLEEFKVMMQSTQRIMNEVESRSGSKKTNSNEMDEKSLEKMFKEMDTDGDGIINVNDFVNGMKNSKRFTIWMAHLGGNRSSMNKKQMNETAMKLSMKHGLTAVSTACSDVLTSLSSHSSIVKEYKKKLAETETVSSEEISEKITELQGIVNKAITQQFHALRKIQKFLDYLSEDSSLLSSSSSPTSSPELSLSTTTDQESLQNGDEVKSPKEEAEAEEKRTILQRQISKMLHGLTAETVMETLEEKEAVGDSDEEEKEEEEEEEEAVIEDLALINKHNPDHQNASKGLAVHFAHESWDLVISIMMGIRMAVARAMSEPDRPLCSNDYTMKEKYSLTPRAQDGNQEACRFFDYAPMMFRKLREIWGISTEDYLNSVGPQQLLSNMMLGSLTSLSELCSEGKSGSFFYYSSDGKYMVKTISKAEHKLFRSILERYFAHCVRFKDTMLVRFLGMHKIRFGKHNKLSNKKIRFVVMGNLFDTQFKIQRRYDLKGSWVGRFTPENKRTDITRALKDLDIIDIDQRIHLNAKDTQLLNQQLEEDSKFLAECKIIDYSLLLGVHKVEGTLPSPRRIPEGQYIPFWQRDWGGVLSDDRSEIYFMGVIDILIKFNARKFGELTAKSMVPGYHKGVSVQFPNTYQKRFMKFMLQLTDPSSKPIVLGDKSTTYYQQKRAEKEEQEEEKKRLEKSYSVSSTSSSRKISKD